MSVEKDRAVLRKCSARVFADVQQKQIAVLISCQLRDTHSCGAAVFTGSFLLIRTFSFVGVKKKTFTGPFKGK